MRIFFQYVLPITCILLVAVLLVSKSKRRNQGGDSDVLFTTPVLVSVVVLLSVIAFGMIYVVLGQLGYL